MLRLLITLSAICILTLDCLSQQFPIYTQYIFNPYLVNPSMVASNRQSEVNLLYRQQWTGIEDGPKTLQFDFQHPFNNRVAVGLNIYDDRSILLSSTSVMATFGYKVPLATEHILSFGLSGGFFSNRIKVEDIPDIDSGDPVILNSSANNFSFDGQFGLSYSFRNLNVGFSLIRLVDHKTLSGDPVQGMEFNELKDKIIFASYQFNLSENFSVQPNFSYRFTSDDLNFYETSAVFSYKNMVAVGGGYRESYGPTAIARVTVKDLQVGYSYDFPSTKASVSTGGTNEIQLKWRFGKVMDRLTKKEKIATTSEEAPVIEVEEKTEITPANVQPEQVTIIVEPTIKLNQEPVIKVIEEIFAATPTPHEFIMVIGSFNKRSNADKLVRELSKAGHQAEVLKSSGSDYYYVHLPAYKTDRVTLQKVLEIRKEKQFKDAWFKKVE